MKKGLTVVCAGLCLLSSGVVAADEQAMADFAKLDAISQHMVAQAMLAAYFIDAALQAGMDADQINAVLADIADNSVISEFWISDETGQIAFTNIPGTGFAFPTDPDPGTQAAPFAVLLKGTENVVIQDAQPRQLDEAIFKYVGVAGIDQRRIVQVGVSADELGSE